MNELEDFIDEVSGMYDYDVDSDEKIVNLSSRDLGIATIFGTSQLAGYCGTADSGNREYTPSEVPTTAEGLHCNYKINDGNYGNSNSAILSTAGNIGYRFTTSKNIDYIEFSRDNTGAYTDRTGGTY